jgi:hypothetical protein
MVSDMADLQSEARAAIAEARSKGHKIDILRVANRLAARHAGSVGLADVRAAVMAASVDPGKPKRPAPKSGREE